MFELVLANRRKSVALIFLMLALLLGVGFAIGFAVYPNTDSFVLGQYRYFIPLGGLIGMAIAFLVWARRLWPRTPRATACSWPQRARARYRSKITRACSMSSRKWPLRPNCRAAESVHHRGHVAERLRRGAGSGTRPWLSPRDSSANSAGTSFRASSPTRYPISPTVTYSS